MGDDTMSREQGVKKIRSLIKDIRFCMLTTVDESGRLHGRPMAASDADEFDGELWFFTHASSHKTAEIDRNHQVNVNYADPSGNNYVSLSGEARLVRDRDEIRRRWNPAYRAWFPDGTDDPDIALLRVSVERAEYWDAPSSAIAHVIGLVKTQILGQQPDVGEHGSVSLQ